MYRFELNAIPRHTRFPDLLAISFAEESFVFQSHNIDRDAAGVRADADTEEFLRLAVRILYRVSAVTDIGIAHGLARCILAVLEPEFAFGGNLQNKLMQRLDFCSLGFGQGGDVVFDLVFDGHKQVLNAVS